MILDGRGLAGSVLPITVLLAMSAAFTVVSLARFRVADVKASF